MFGLRYAHPLTHPYPYPYPHPHTHTRTQDLKAQLGYAYLAQGGQQGEGAAAALWTNVLNETQQKHIKAMLGYTTLARRAGDNSSALRGLLGILVQNSTDKEVRRAFGAAMREVPDSVAILEKDMPMKEDAASANAFGFLALVMKESGAVTQGVHFYRKYVDRPTFATPFFYIHPFTLTPFTPHPTQELQTCPWQRLLRVEPGTHP